MIFPVPSAPLTSASTTVLLLLFCVITNPPDQVALLSVLKRYPSLLLVPAIVRVRFRMFASMFQLLECAS